MPTIPERYAPAIQWCRDRLDAWSENRALLGLSEAGVDELGQNTLAAGQARQRYLDARRELRDAALVYRTEVGSMRATAAALLAAIRATAQGATDPAEIYSTASVPPPADRGPAPAPGTPRGFATALLSGGALRVAFDCPHPRGVRGVTYRVERLLDARRNPGARPEFLLNAKKRTFTDATIPAGTAGVEYRVTAQTSTRDGEAAWHTVRFGQEAPGASPVVAPKGERAA